MDEKEVIIGLKYKTDLSKREEKLSEWPNQPIKECTGELQKITRVESCIILSLVKKYSSTSSSQVWNTSKVQTSNCTVKNHLSRCKHW